MTAREIVDDDWHRCFIALVPDRATRDALAAMPVGAAARRVGVEQLHMTLAFLGTVPPAKGLRLAQQLAAIVAPLPPQRAQGAEYWPSAAHPRLVVVPFFDSDALAGLEARVRASVERLQLPLDDHRPFRPHITLARFARSTRTAASSASAHSPAAAAAANTAGGLSSPAAPLLEAATLTVTPRFDSLTLYSSTLARHGARYRALASVAVPSA
jgi:2'-5' RNA ligase